jgi:hypothetical protein
VTIVAREITYTLTGSTVTNYLTYSVTIADSLEDLTVITTTMDNVVVLNVPIRRTVTSAVNAQVRVTINADFNDGFIC